MLLWLLLYYRLDTRALCVLMGMLYGQKPPKNRLAMASVVLQTGHTRPLCANAHAPCPEACAKNSIPYLC